MDLGHICTFANPDEVEPPELGYRAAEVHFFV